MDDIDNIGEVQQKKISSITSESGNVYKIGVNTGTSSNPDSLGPSFDFDKGSLTNFKFSTDSKKFDEIIKQANSDYGESLK